MKQKIRINLCMPKSLLQKIEDRIKGRSRSEKIAKCVGVGYELLTKEGE